MSDHGEGPFTAEAQVVSLYRYPVKSMAGEQLDALDIEPRGVVGDRLWSVRTPEDKIGSGKSTNRFRAVRGLLELRSRCADGRVIVSTGDGSTSCFVDDADAAAWVSGTLGQPLTFAQETDVAHHDDGPVSLLGLGSVAAFAGDRDEDVDVRRFRPNIIFDGLPAYAEDGWVGRTVRIGTAVLAVEFPSPRCVMVDMRTADLPAQPGNLAAIERDRAGRLGVIASVVAPGRVRLGDVVELA